MYLEFKVSISTWTWLFRRPGILLLGKAIRGLEFYIFALTLKCLAIESSHCIFTYFSFYFQVIFCPWFPVGIHRLHLDIGIIGKVDWAFPILQTTQKLRSWPHLGTLPIYIA